MSTVTVTIARGNRSHKFDLRIDDINSLASTLHNKSIDAGKSAAIEEFSPEVRRIFAADAALYASISEQLEAAYMAL